MKPLHATGGYPANRDRRILRITNNRENRDEFFAACFTLIELMVVISLIAILLCVLLPALKTARDCGKRIACVSNERQVGLALFSYANDFNDYCFPNNTVNEATADFWCERAFEYIKNPYLFICPSHPGNKERLEAYKTKAGWQLAKYNGADYGYNWRYIGTSYGLGMNSWPFYGAPAKLSAIKAPPSTVFFAESVKIGTGADNHPERGYSQVCWKIEEYSSVAARHMKTGNVFWADGHCAQEKKETIFSDSPTDNSKEIFWDLN